MIPTQIMTDTIGIKRLAGNGAYGPIFDVQADIQCYFEQGFKKVVNANGEEIIASGFAIIAPSVCVGIGDFVIHDDQNYTVVDVQKLKVLDALHHQELVLQSVSEI